MSQSQALLKTIEAIYDAGADHERWPNALGLLSELVGGHFCDLVVVDHRNRIVTEAASRPDPELLLRNLSEDLLKENLWFQRRHLAHFNKTVVGEQLASPAEIKRTRFYAEGLKAVDLFHICAFAFSNGSDLSNHVNVVRSEKHPSFGQHEVDLMDSVAPHVSRAAKITVLLQGVNLYVAGLESAANQLAFGLLLIDETGRVLFANAEAERLLREGRIMYQRESRLVGATGASQQRLSAFLSRLALLPEAAALHLAKADGHGLKLIGAPLPERRQDFACLSPTARSVIFLFDDAANAPSPMRLIAQLYGLTPAECRLAEALLASQTLAEYGERVGLTRNTIKTELKSLFAKTGTARQSDLVRQLAKLAAVAVA
jgi:DNA-binding CsgD family transcriptional regulator/PAS domain-containing protein